MYIAQSIAQDSSFTHMSNKFLKIHPADNVLVALTDLKAGEKISDNGSSFTLSEDIPAKHKFVPKPCSPMKKSSCMGCSLAKP
jgi:altronate hydrolase